ncbi:hypothetical protein [Agromyces sp. PvR057]|uniref:WXG100 family type VII secretion target n=1 Tax=Agromyces sp. PvR057 TaxID=3156403 RepID=UPI0033983D76
MNMAMYGADVANLRALASRFDQAADRLDSSRGMLSSQIRVNAWVGPAATKFRMEWDNDRSRQVAAAAAALREAGRRLRSNADEQEAASAVGGGATGGGAVGTGPIGADVARSRIGDLIGIVPDSAQGLIDAIKDPKILDDLSIWEGLTALAGSAGMLDVDVPGLSGLGLGMDVVSWTNEVRTGSFDFFDGVDVAATALKESKHPVAVLGSVAVSATSYAAQEAMKTDFSTDTWDDNVSYLARNPGAVVEEVGKAVLTVGTKALGWLL